MFYTHEAPRWVPVPVDVITAARCDANKTAGKITYLSGFDFAASASIVDVGLAFYDVPIAFTFVAGQRYDVAFRGNLATSWGGPQTSMPFYAFNRASPGGAYIDGPVRVVDGACHPIDVCSGYGNTLIPHVRLETVETTAVPEPATLTLLATGLAVTGRRLTRRK